MVSPFVRYGRTLLMETSQGFLTVVDDILARDPDTVRRVEEAARISAGAPVREVLPSELAKKGVLPVQGGTGRVVIHRATTAGGRPDVRPEATAIDVPVIRQDRDFFRPTGFGRIGQEGEAGAPQRVYTVTAPVLATTRQMEAAKDAVLLELGRAGWSVSGYSIGTEGAFLDLPKYRSLKIKMSKAGESEGAAKVAAFRAAGAAFAKQDGVVGPIANWAVAFTDEVVVQTAKDVTDLPTVLRRTPWWVWAIVGGVGLVTVGPILTSIFQARAAVASARSQP